MSARNRAHLFPYSQYLSSLTVYQFSGVCQQKKKTPKRLSVADRIYLQAIAATATAAAARMEVTITSVMARSPFFDFFLRPSAGGDQRDNNGRGCDDDGGDDEFHGRSPFSFLCGVSLSPVDAFTIPQPATHLGGLSFLTHYLSFLIVILQSEPQLYVPAACNEAFEQDDVPKIELVIGVDVGVQRIGVHVPSRKRAAQRHDVFEVDRPVRV